MKSTIASVLTFMMLSSSAMAADDVAQLKSLTAKQWTVPKLDMKMVLIPAGSFTMGSPKDEAERRGDETQHEVTIASPFYMGICEVTQGQYYGVMYPDYDHDSWQYARGPIHDGLAFFYRKRSGGRDYKGGPLLFKNPMECVTWDKAREFCRIITERESKAGRLPEGYVYRLPTEAEWEYACRTGGKTPYNVMPAGGGTNYKDPEYLDSFANVGEGSTTPVGTRKPNAWGLYDMHGNVYEWCLDWYGLYPEGKATDPIGPSEGKKRVARGGCFNGPALFAPPGVIARSDSYTGAAPFLRSASRYRFYPDVDFYAILGFRVVLAKDVPVAEAVKEKRDD